MGLKLDDRADTKYELIPRIQTSSAIGSIRALAHWFAEIVQAVPPDHLRPEIGRGSCFSELGAQLPNLVLAVCKLRLGVGQGHL